jgi:hypothetical protein
MNFLAGVNGTLFYSCWKKAFLRTMESVVSFKNGVRKSSKFRHDLCKFDTTFYRHDPIKNSQGNQ